MIKPAPGKERRIRTMEEELEAYKSYLMQEEKSVATVEKYIRDVRKFLEFAKSRGQGNVPGTGIPATNVQGTGIQGTGIQGTSVQCADSRGVEKEAVMDYKKMLVEHYRPSSVNSILAALNHYMLYLGRADCHVKLLKIQKAVFCEQNKELNRSEYVLLVQEAKKRNKDRLALIMETICSTGIRIGELHYITAEAVRLGRSEVHGKGKERVILIPQKLCAKLLSYCREHNITKGCVFITRNGSPVNRSNVWSEMNGLCVQAGVDPEKVFPHNMRHLFARTYYNQQKDIVRLADILGHSSIETTRIYTKSSCGEYERELNEMELII